MNNTALVLEGGGLRGVWTGGVLDWLIENNIEFPYVIGVSMGACNAPSYIAKQPGRNRLTSISYVKDKRYMSLYNLLRLGQLSDMDFMFDQVGEKFHPLDIDTFENSSTKFEIVTTNCISGEASYMDGSKYNTLLDNLKASSSLPFISKPHIISNVPHLDGGLTDPIPFKRALELGYEKIVVILTQPLSYVKEPLKLPRFLQSKYKKYPNILKALENRHHLYNKQRHDLFQLYNEGKAFIIMPTTKIPAKRIDKNVKRLHLAYDSGYEYMCKHGDAMKKFLKS